LLSYFKKFIQKIISLSGYKLIKNSNFVKLYRTLDQSLKILVKNKEPIIFDVGAHNGESIKRYRNIFKNAKFHSFEPQKKNFFKLKKYENNKIKINNFALGAQNKILKFNINDDDSTSSFLKPFHSEKLINKKLKLNKIENIKIETLDRYVEKHRINTIDILKIDVQGFERDVLLGAKKTLKNIVKIVELEIIFIDYYQKKSSFYELENILYPMGFELFTVSSPVLKDKDYQLKWLDAIYISKKFFL